MTEISGPKVKSLVLVVDDSKYIRNTLRQIMEGEGYQVIEAKTEQKH